MMAEPSRDLDILRVGSFNAMIRGALVILGWGSGNVGPNWLLKRRAKTRVTSRCCNWSSPTGTVSAL